MEKVKIKDITYEIKSIKEHSPLLEIEFNTNVDLSNVDLTLIDVLTEGNVKCRSFNDYTTIYKYSDNLIVLSNDGSIYTEPIITTPEPIEPYIPTPEEIALQLEFSQTNKIKESNIKLEQFLFEHPLLFTDGLYYSVTKDKQNLLTAQLMTFTLELQLGIPNPN